MPNLETNPNYWTKARDLCLVIKGKNIFKSSGILTNNQAYLLIGENLKILIKFAKNAITDIDLVTVKLSAKRQGIISNTDKIPTKSQSIISNTDNIPRKFPVLYISFKYDRVPL